MDHIAINTRLLLAGRLEGIGRYAHEVLQRLVHMHPEVRFSFLFDRPFDQQFIYADNVKGYHIPPPARHPLLWHAWFHAAVPLALRWLKPQLFFSPEFYLTSARWLPQVPVFHDLAYEHFPDHVGGAHQQYYLRWSPRYARRASHILTVSDFTKQDIVQRYGIDSQNITVAYNGASGDFAPIPEIEQQAVRRQFSEGAPYFLYVGAIQPRKNIARLLQAFDAFKEETASPVRLLLAGRKAWQYADALQAYEQMKHREAVIMTGYLPDTDLQRVYASAMALCYVPYFEGFGLPILEAMCCDVPVICANTSSMPEVAGDAALCVNPYETDEIQVAMRRIWESEALRTKLVEAGRQQRERFSWDKTAEAVSGVLFGNFEV
ncbi:MAG: glycosyltransferase family 1 protein [Bacteroidia bacterium]